MKPMKRGGWLALTLLSTIGYAMTLRCPCGWICRCDASCRCPKYWAAKIAFAALFLLAIAMIVRLRRSRTIA